MGAPPPDARRPTGPIRALLRGVAFWTAVWFVVQGFVVDDVVVVTGSMEPEIIGRRPAGDWVAISKLDYRLRDPRRFEVVFFRHPLNATVPLLKRLCGLPGETVLLMRGDLWIEAAGFSGSPAEGLRAGRISVVRKPPELQREVFSRHPVILPGECGAFGERAFDRLFETTPADRGRFAAADGGGVRLDAAGLVLARFRKPITDHLPDSLDLAEGSLAPGPGTGGANPVGDISLGFRITAESADGAAVLRFDDVVEGRAFEARVPAGPGRAATITVSEAGATRVRASARAFLEPGRAVEVRFEKADEALRLFVGGREAARVDLDPPPEAALREGAVAFGAEGGAFAFRAPALERDLYWIPGPRARFEVPPDAYLFLGDHSFDSADARFWRTIALRDRATGEVLIGDADGRPAPGVRGSADNPRRTEDGAWEFVDLSGRPRRFASESAFELGERTPAPFVPKSAILGRAIAVTSPLARSHFVR